MTRRHIASKAPRKASVATPALLPRISTVPNTASACRRLSHRASCSARRRTPRVLDRRLADCQTSAYRRSYRGRPERRRRRLTQILRQNAPLRPVGRAGGQGRPSAQRKQVLAMPGSLDSKAAANDTAAGALTIGTTGSQSHNGPSKHDNHGAQGTMRGTTTDGHSEKSHCALRALRDILTEKGYVEAGGHSTPLSRI